MSAYAAKTVLCGRCGEWLESIGQPHPCKPEDPHKETAFLEYDKNNVWHVYPVNDLKEHSLEGLICACGANVEIQFNGGVLVKHNSYDHREYFEKGRKNANN